MSWTSLDPTEIIETQRAEMFRTLHVVTRRWFRKVCDHCGNRWGRHGCAMYLWATDLLSSKSRIVVRDRPNRPRRRHTADYVAALERAKAELNRRHRNQRWVRPLPT